MQLHNSQNINDMRIPPSNHLEKLSGDLSGLWSVRVNQQWRLVFLWEVGNAMDVRIIDYH
jgi:toxin HigB-1